MPKSIHRPEYDVFRELLRDARMAAGRTQAELAAALGRSQSFISDAERGVRRLDINELRDVCIELGMEFCSFVGRLERELAAPGRTRPGRKGSKAR